MIDLKTKIPHAPAPPATRRPTLIFVNQRGAQMCQGDVAIVNMAGLLMRRVVFVPAMQATQVKYSCYRLVWATTHTAAHPELFVGYPELFLRGSVPQPTCRDKLPR